MRDIKFRAKSTDANVWITGSLRVDSQGTNIYSDGFIAQVDPSTIGQYIGLRDSTKSEIYEGDIYGFPVEFHPRGCGCMVSFYGKGVITWDEYHSNFLIKFKYEHSWYEQDLSEWKCEEFKLLGNIHDNPDLLK